jgi:hypothetical protein
MLIVIGNMIPDARVIVKPIMDVNTVCNNCILIERDYQSIILVCSGDDVWDVLEDGTSRRTTHNWSWIMDVFFGICWHGSDNWDSTYNDIKTSIDTILQSCTTEIVNMFHPIFIMNDHESRYYPKLTNSPKYYRDAISFESFFLDAQIVVNETLITKYIEPYVINSMLIYQTDLCKDVQHLIMKCLIMVWFPEDRFNFLYSTKIEIVSVHQKIIHSHHHHDTNRYLVESRAGQPTRSPERTKI